MWAELWSHVELVWSYRGPTVELPTRSYAKKCLEEVTSEKICAKVKNYIVGIYARGSKALWITH